MKPPDFCVYPPRLASDVDITPQDETVASSYIVGSASVGRYLILGAKERQVLDLLDGSRVLSEICDELSRREGTASSPAVLARFLTKLDEVGVLAGQRGVIQQPILPGSQFYVRWSLFNPDQLFARMLPVLRWIWTPGFFAASVLLIAFAALLALFYWNDLSQQGAATLGEHYLVVLVAAWLVTVTHELAHGMTSKAFGGRATEIGVLLIYYCLPALYCNVSGLHLIARRSRRLWVIAAGIYWQLLVGASALVVWFVFDAHTLAARAAMVVVLGSLLDVVFNINPLIKLDGYYFLSQWLRIPNLMDRSRACWRVVLRRVLFGERDAETGRFTLRDRRILLTFGLLSLLYNLALPVVIVWYAAQYLMDWLNVVGLLLAASLGVVYLWCALKRLGRREGIMSSTSSSKWSRRRLVPAAIAMGAAAAFCMPWTASVGSYGTLTAVPGQEAIIWPPRVDRSLCSMSRPASTWRRVRPSAACAISISMSNSRRCGPSCSASRPMRIG